MSDVDGMPGAIVVVTGAVVDGVPTVGDDVVPLGATCRGDGVVHAALTAVATAVTNAVANRATGGPP